jgi:hypothetical protein
MASKVGSLLGKTGKFLGGNLAVAAAFMAANKLLEPIFYPSAGGEMPGGMGDEQAQLMELLAQQQGMGGSGQFAEYPVTDDLVAKAELRDQLAASRGQALGSSYQSGARVLSPELLSLIGGYEREVERLSRPAQRGYAQLMAEKGFY